MNRKMGIVVLVLSLLAALEPLSIDLYLPAFTDIAESLQVSLSEVQISLSIFLAGFAIGQLFWGSLSDYYGRKNPILLATALYTVSSFAFIVCVVHMVCAFDSQHLKDDRCHIKMRIR